ncbi:MAG: PTS system mannose/fructose/sorbose family transporter subunit IID [Anaerolineaceae bacterium]|nr:PTS system mannose/fructose/sorbose family transporter subunit IID [Anaerolineaceae bacterium]
MEHTNLQTEGNSMPIKTNKLLSKADLVKVYVNWIMYCLSCQNMERMQAPGFARCMGLVAKKLYKDDPEKQRDLVARHTLFFNTQPSIGAIIPGIILGMEEQKASGIDVPDGLINGIKSALMGPFAGIGDSLVDGTLIPILMSIALGLSAKTGSISGVLFYIVSFLGILVTVSWLLFKTGYTQGLKSAEIVLQKDMKDMLTKAASLIGLVVIGSIAAQYVSANIGLTYTSGDLTVSLQSVLDSLFPSLLPLFLTIGSWLLLSKKKLNIGLVFLIFIVIAVIGSLTHVLVP